jgi:hypothetical protein
MAGRCLNTFARGEQAVAVALQVARAQDPKVRIPHLAGQRLTELERVALMTAGTENQKASLARVLADWKEHDERRPCFSHGMTTALIDRMGEWHVQFDMNAWRANQAHPVRLNWSKDEAFAFEARLASCFTSLSSQLGQLRKRLS